MFVPCPDCGLHYDDAAFEPSNENGDHEHKFIADRPVDEHIFLTRMAWKDHEPPEGVVLAGPRHVTAPPLRVVRGDPTEADVSDAPIPDGS